MPLASHSGAWLVQPTTLQHVLLILVIHAMFFHTAVLRYADRPETPLNLTAVNLTSRAFTLLWVEPHDNNAPIQGYMYV